MVSIDQKHGDCITFGEWGDGDLLVEFLPKALHFVGVKDTMGTVHNLWRKLILCFTWMYSINYEVVISLQNDVVEDDLKMHPKKRERRFL